MKKRTLVGLLICCAWRTAAAASQLAPDTCDRECLRGKVTQLLHALVKHDVSSVPVADTNGIPRTVIGVLPHTFVAPMGDVDFYLAFGSRRFFARSALVRITAFSTASVPLRFDLAALVEVIAHSFGRGRLTHCMSSSVLTAT
jgi:hypothetical protein